VGQDFIDKQEAFIREQVAIASVGAVTIAAVNNGKGKFSSKPCGHSLVCRMTKKKNTA
jgi:hypothetical protein